MARCAVHRVRPLWAGAVVILVISTALALWVTVCVLLVLGIKAFVRSLGA